MKADNIMSPTMKQSLLSTLIRSSGVDGVKWFPCQSSRSTLRALVRRGLATFNDDSTWSGITLTDKGKHVAKSLWTKSVSWEILALLSASRVYGDNNRLMRLACATVLENCSQFTGIVQDSAKVIAEGRQ